MAKVSPQQEATRRRALGRKLSKHASDIKVLTGGYKGNPDLVHLTAKESKMLEQRVAHLDKMADDLAKLGERLEKSQ